jgi:hypothetical protein
LGRSQFKANARLAQGVGPEFKAQYYKKKKRKKGRKETNTQAPSCPMMCSVLFPVFFYSIFLAALVVGPGWVLLS